MENPADYAQQQQWGQGDGGGVAGGDTSAPPTGAQAQAQPPATASTGWDQHQQQHPQAQQHQGQQDWSQWQQQGHQQWPQQQQQQWPQQQGWGQQSGWDQQGWGNQGYQNQQYPGWGPPHGGDGGQMPPNHAPVTHPPTQGYHPIGAPAQQQPYNSQHYGGPAPGPVPGPGGVVPPVKKKKLPADELEILDRRLGKLEGKSDSIKGTAEWIMARAYACRQIAIIIQKSMFSIDFDDFQRKLHVLYLVNHILHDSLRLRPKIEDLDPMSLSMLFCLPDMLRHAWYKHDDADREQVDKLLRLWASRFIFNESTIQDLSNRMKSDPPADHQTMKQEFPLPPPTSSLHLTPGFLVDVILKTGAPPYEPVEPIRVPAKQTFSKPEPGNSLIDQLERLGKALEKIDPENIEAYPFKIEQWRDQYRERRDKEREKEREQRERERRRDRDRHRDRRDRDRRRGRSRSRSHSRSRSRSPRRSRDERR